MRRWFAIWTAFVLLSAGGHEWHNPLYPDLSWMGASYLVLHHLVALGTVEFFALWFALLVPPILLWYAGAAILVIARWAAVILGLRPRS